MSIKKTEGENKKKGAFSRFFSKQEDIPYDEYEEIFMNPVEEAQNESLNEEVISQEKPDEENQEENSFYQYELEENTDDEQNVLVAEKEQIEVFTDLPENDNEQPKEAEELTDANATAVFTFSKDLPEGSEKTLDDFDISKLENTAKSYYNKTHDSELEGKVDELLKLANSGFSQELESTDHTDLGLEMVVEEQEVSSKKKKNKKREIVSNDDMELLASLAGEQENTSVFDASQDLIKKYADLLDSDEPDVEYTDKAQEKTIISSLRNKAISSVFSVLLSLVAFLVCLYFETAHGTQMWHPFFLETGRYGLVYAMCMLQIMFISVMFNLDGIIRGFKGMTKAKARPESISVMTVIICTLQVIAGVTFAPHRTELTTYCSVGCFALLFLSINSFIKAYTNLNAFCIAASSTPKYTTCQLDATSHEAAAFSKYLEEDTAIFTVQKADFISGFFKKAFASPESSRCSFSIYISSIVLGLVSGIISAILTKNAYTAFSAGCAVALCALPVNVLISTALPFFAASLKSLRTKTAFIGEAACDTYTNAGILSFDDSEVFPPRGVKVSSIRTYGDTRIDKIIIYMARIFNKLEGPLSYIFDRSIQGGDENIGDAEIIQSTPDGIKVTLDGKDIILGTSSFLKLYDIHTPSDNIDESFLQSLGSIIYMATGSTLCAKFYIKYTINQNFESILKSLYDAGICAGIKTIDPCINNQLVSGNLRGSGYPVSVIKSEGMGTKLQEVQDSLPGSIISLTGTHNFLKGFIRLDNLRNTYRSNAIIGKISSIIGIVASVAITLSGTVSILSPSFIIVLGLVWCVPTLLMSLLSK